MAADVDDDSSVRSDETADDYALDDGDNDESIASLEVVLGSSPLEQAEAELVHGHFHCQQ